MDLSCAHPTNSTRPRERGLFLVTTPTSMTRRHGLVLALAAGLGLASAGVHANSFDVFFRAIAADSPQTLQSLAQRGFDLNTRNEKSEPPLVLALRLDALKVVDFLLTRPDVDVEARNAHDESPLMLAALKGRAAQVAALIRRGAHVNKTGWAPLHYAASHTSEAAAEVVRLLLEHHAYIDAASPNGSTPLMMAAMYGHTSVVGQLLEAGADATLKNEQGLTAMDFAQRAGRTAEADRIARSIRSRNATGRW